MERSGTAPELSLTLGCPSVQTSIPEPDRRVPWRSTLANPVKVDVYTNYPNSRPKVRDSEQGVGTVIELGVCVGPSVVPRRNRDRYDCARRGDLPLCRIWFVGIRRIGDRNIPGSVDARTPRDPTEGRVLSLRPLYPVSASVQNRRARSLTAACGCTISNAWKHRSNT